MEFFTWICKCKQQGSKGVKKSMEKKKIIIITTIILEPSSFPPLLDHVKERKPFDFFLHVKFLMTLRYWLMLRFFFFCRCPACVMFTHLGCWLHRWAESYNSKASFRAGNWRTGPIHGRVSLLGQHLISLNTKFKSLTFFSSSELLHRTISMPYLGIEIVLTYVTRDTDLYSEWWFLISLVIQTSHHYWQGCWWNRSCFMELTWSCWLKKRSGVDGKWKWKRTHTEAGPKRLTAT